MTRTLICFLLCLLVSPQLSYGQRHIKGQLALTPYVGIADKFPAGTLSQDGNGFLAVLDLVRYTRSEKYWKFSYQYDRKYYAFYDAALISERHLVGFDYSLATLKDHRRRFYIAPMIGTFVGVETINRNNYELAQGTILTPSQGILGLNGALEGEFYLTEKTALFLGVAEKWFITSDLTKFHTYGQLGLRFSFFKN